ncbi:OLC1v1035861C1 [Oldenlandia corymbosa var. corymbosa]|uniref:OLC1v1035861C1 n=1 Tax=Oldenlandia corymbosa var. corymbosa TaxID=529605 RepID=A0AAV1CVT6_OLDCO|nr:OLC1v1035861C1 [Oldenlandia corymbosa var. corymbosa]
MWNSWESFSECLVKEFGSTEVPKMNETCAIDLVVLGNWVERVSIEINDDKSLVVHDDFMIDEFLFTGYDDNNAPLESLVHSSESLNRASATLMSAIVHSSVDMSLNVEFDSVTLGLKNKKLAPAVVDRKCEGIIVRKCSINGRNLMSLFAIEPGGMKNHFVKNFVNLVHEDIGVDKLKCADDGFLGPSTQWPGLRMMRIAKTEEEEGGLQVVRRENVSIQDEMRKMIGMVMDRSPFIPDIRDEPKPLDFDFSKDFTKYSGDTDVSQWLQGYVHVMRIRNVSLNFMAKALPSYLTEQAQRWFGQLLEGCIISFEDLSIKLATRFFHSKQITRMSIDLSSIKQGQHESFSDFHRRFIRETLQIDNIDERDVQNGFIQGLNPFGKSSMLRVTLSTKPPWNSKEMWAIVENHIQWEHTLKRSQESFTAIGMRVKPKINMKIGQRYLSSIGS